MLDNKITILILVCTKYLLFLCTLSKTERTGDTFCKTSLYGLEYFQLDTTTVPSPDIKVTMWFQSTKGSGVLLAVTGKDNVWHAVGMVNSTIKKISSSPSHLTRNTSKKAIVAMVTVNQWYNMQIRINKRMIKYSIQGNSLDLDSVINNTNHNSMLYFGGMPFNTMASKSFQNFTGCMDKMVVKGYGIREKEDFSKKILFHCPDCETRTIGLPDITSKVTFFLSKMQQTQNVMRFSFYFRTARNFSKLSEWKANSLRLELFMNNDVLQVKQSSNKYKIHARTSNIGKIFQKHWNYVSMEVLPRISMIEVALNGDARMIVIPKRKHSYKEGIIFETFMIGDSFTGCVRNIELQDEVIDFSTSPRWVIIDRAVVGDCDLPSTKIYKDRLETPMSSNKTTTKLVDMGIRSFVGNYSVDLGNGSVSAGDGLSNNKKTDLPSVDEAVSEIGLVYQISASFVVALFVLIVIYVIFILVKNKLQRRLADEHEEEKEECTVTRHIPSSTISEDGASHASTKTLTDGSNNSTANKPILSDRPNEGSNGLLPIACEQGFCSSMLSIRPPSPLKASLSRGNLLVLSPQPHKRSHEFGVADIPCVVLTLQGEEGTSRPKEEHEARICYEGHQVKLTHQDMKTQTKRNQPKKTTNPAININSSSGFNNNGSLTYNWAYIKADSETECSESERVKCSSSVGFRPFSLRILEANESDEENDYFVENCHGNKFQTFRSKSTDNLGNEQFLKVCFDPYLSSSQGEKLVCFGVHSSSDPSVRAASPVDQRNVHLNYQQDRRENYQRGKYRKLQIDQTPLPVQTATSQNDISKKKIANQNQGPHQDQNINTNSPGNISQQVAPKQIYLDDSNENDRNHNVEDGCEKLSNWPRKKSDASLLQQCGILEHYLQQEKLEQQLQQSQHYQHHKQEQEQQNKVGEEQFNQDLPDVVQQQLQHLKQQQKQQQQQQRPQQQQPKLQKQVEPRYEQEPQQQKMLQQRQHLLVHELQQRNLKQDKAQEQLQQPQTYQEQLKDEQQLPQEHEHLSVQSCPSSPTNVSKQNDPETSNKANAKISIEDIDANAVASISRSNNGTNGYLNPWVLKNPQVSKRKPTRLNKEGSPSLKAKSSLLIPRANHDDAEPRKVLKRSSWANGNAPRDQSREIDLMLKGTVPVKKPPSNPAFLLTVPGTKVRPRSESMS